MVENKGTSADQHSETSELDFGEFQPTVETKLWKQLDPRGKDRADVHEHGGSESQDDDCGFERAVTGLVSEYDKFFGRTNKNAAAAESVESTNSTGQPERRDPVTRLHASVEAPEQELHSGPNDAVLSKHTFENLILKNGQVEEVTLPEGKFRANGCDENGNNKYIRFPHDADSEAQEFNGQIRLKDDKVIVADDVALKTSEYSAKPAAYTNLAVSAAGAREQLETPERSSKNGVTNNGGIQFLGTAPPGQNEQNPDAATKTADFAVAVEHKDDGKEEPYANESALVQDSGSRDVHESVESPNNVSSVYGYIRSATVGATQIVAGETAAKAVDGIFQDPSKLGQLYDQASEFLAKAQNEVKQSQESDLVSSRTNSSNEKASTRDSATDGGSESNANDSLSAHRDSPQKGGAEKNEPGSADSADLSNHTSRTQETGGELNSRVTADSGQSDHLGSASVEATLQNNGREVVPATIIPSDHGSLADSNGSQIASSDKASLVNDTAMHAPGSAPQAESATPAQSRVGTESSLNTQDVKFGSTGARPLSDGGRPMLAGSKDSLEGVQVSSVMNQASTTQFARPSTTESGINSSQSLDSANGSQKFAGKTNSLNGLQSDTGKINSSDGLPRDTVKTPALDVAPRDTTKNAPLDGSALVTMKSAPADVAKPDAAYDARHILSDVKLAQPAHSDSIVNKPDLEQVARQLAQPASTKDASVNVSATIGVLTGSSLNQVPLNFNQTIAASATVNLSNNPTASPLAQVLNPVPTQAYNPSLSQALNPFLPAAFSPSLTQALSNPVQSGRAPLDNSSPNIPVRSADAAAQVSAQMTGARIMSDTRADTGIGTAHGAELSLKNDVGSLSFSNGKQLSEGRYMLVEISLAMVLAAGGIRRILPSDSAQKNDTAGSANGSGGAGRRPIEREFSAKSREQGSIDGLKFLPASFKPSGTLVFNDTKTLKDSFNLKLDLNSASTGKRVWLASNANSVLIKSFGLGAREASGVLLKNDRQNEQVLTPAKLVPAMAGELNISYSHSSTVNSLLNGSLRTPQSRLEEAMDTLIDVVGEFIDVDDPFQTFVGAINPARSGKRNARFKDPEVPAEASDADGGDDDATPPSQLVLLRPTCLISQKDTLLSVAEEYFSDPYVAWLIADLNQGNCRQHYMDGKRVVEFQSRQKITLPVWQDIVAFYGSMPADARPENLVTIVSSTEIDREILNSVLGPIMAQNHADKKTH